MTDECADCQAGPRDVEGHANLVLHVLTAAQNPQQRTAFKCSVCGVEWIRTYMGSGVFAWNRLG